MKKHILWLLVLSGNSVAGVQSMLSQPFTFSQKIALSSLLCGIGISSNILAYRVVQNRCWRWLSCAGLSGSGLAFLLKIWHAPNSSERNIPESQMFIEKKVGELIDVIDRVSKSYSHDCMPNKEDVIKKIIDKEEVDQQIKLCEEQITIKRNFVERFFVDRKPHFLSDLKAHYTVLCCRTGYDLYSILQYDQQVVRRKAYETKCEHIKQMVEGWYETNEADAIVMHIRSEVEKELRKSEVVSQQLYEAIKNLFDAQPSRFSPILDSSKHKKLLGKLHAYDNWIWLYLLKQESGGLNKIKEIVRRVL